MNQNGSALLVSLILLAILTLGGLAAISSSSLEEKVTGNVKDLQTAFRMGEATLLNAEAFLQKNQSNISHFTNNCDQGLCFNGIVSDSVTHCRTNNASPWRNESLWLDNTRTRLFTMSVNNIQLTARYIIEFLCYVPKVPSGPTADVANIHDWAQLFRVTVKANGFGQGTAVMLQTTYKK